MRRASPATVVFTATPGVGMGGQRQRLESAVAPRQQRDLDLGRRPVARDRQFLMPVDATLTGAAAALASLTAITLSSPSTLFEPKPPPIARRRPEPCAGSSLKRPAIFAASSATDWVEAWMVRFVAVEFRNRRMRLETGMLLDPGPESPFEQERIALRAGARDRAARRLFLERERGGRAADIAYP